MNKLNQEFYNHAWDGCITIFIYSLFRWIEELFQRFLPSKFTFLRPLKAVNSLNSQYTSSRKKPKQTRLIVSKIVFWVPRTKRVSLLNRGPFSTKFPSDHYSDGNLESRVEGIIRLLPWLHIRTQRGFSMPEKSVFNPAWRTFCSPEMLDLFFKTFGPRIMMQRAPLKNGSRTNKALSHNSEKRVTL